MTALDARAMAAEVNAKRAAEQWAEIDKAIQLAALDGRNECTLELTLLPKTKEKLDALGYKFNEESSPRNEFHTTITW